ncbi:MAG: hypothetical protein PSV17_07960 [Methylotenera sp.]|uniref:hypothetical protein n=1 Tax=Methylotenera sp. TaxID=2051956 RepID=UPI0024874A60|nr:hypothetical protein [Methylotenera sp.]MDI1309354.1 hypothetical protein [Methylotenera sp.]
MKHNEASRWIQTSVLLTALLLSACSEIAYKRGATASDLAAMKKNCTAKDSTKEAIAKCMADNGWTIQNLDGEETIASMQNEPDPVIEATENADNRQIGKPVVATKTTSTEKSFSQKKLTDPMDMFQISSWWKLGGSPDNLKSSIQECVNSLGEAHEPGIQSKKVTRGLLLCMQKKDWHGLREKP